jgi:hypothetical protein
MKFEENNTLDVIAISISLSDPKYTKHWLS